MRNLLALLILGIVVHGDASWIGGNPKYVDGLGSHCCGVADCHRLSALKVERVEDGWRVKETGQVFQDGTRGLYRSINSDFWYCQRPQEHQYRCLFVPEAEG
jgi:hypothetical protein